MIHPAEATRILNSVYTYGAYQVLSNVRESPVFAYRSLGKAYPVHNNLFLHDRRVYRIVTNNFRNLYWLYLFYE